MERVYDKEQKPFDQIRLVGIAIGEVPGDQRHMGLLHRDEATSSIFMLHLKWHHKLSDEPADQDFLWVDPAIPARRLGHVEDVCRLVWRANQKDGIPYGFSPPADCIDEETGKHLFGRTGLGLTCATFVLAVFHRAGLSLATYESWPTDRPGDRVWQEKIVRWLNNTGADSEHVDGVRNDVGSVRFRPEEVAGAAVLSPWPVDFNAAVACGAQILKRLQHA